MAATEADVAVAPSVDLPSVDLPSVDLPSVDLLGRLYTRGRRR